MPTFGFIPSPSSNGFHLGPFFFHAYGIMYVLAVAVAILVARHEWEMRGGSRELIYELAWWGFPAGLLGGRIYFLITTPSQIPDHWYGFAAIWDGGLGIWGGIAAGVGVGVWRVHRRLGGWSGVRDLLNTASPCLLFAQAIGRIGNYFNQELFGKPSTLPWALKIAPEYRPAGYAQYATFQPSFLYEMIFDTLWGIILIALNRRRVLRAPGAFALYVAGYSGYRIFEETIRIDYSVRILGMRLNFWVALVGTISGLTWFVWIQWFSPRAKRERAEGIEPGMPILPKEERIAARRSAGQAA